MFAPRLTVISPGQVTGDICLSAVPEEVGPFAPTARSLCYCRRLSPVSMEVRLEWLVHRARICRPRARLFVINEAAVALVRFAGVPV